MASKPEVVVVGAGILGLASAYHILVRQRHLKLLILDRLPGPGRGTTARSAAAFRDMFATPVNRHLAQGSLTFYESLQASGVPLDLLPLGYLWLLTAAQADRLGPAFEAMAAAGVRFTDLGLPELARRLPSLKLGDIHRALLGRRCGILNPNRLAGFYAKEVERLGGRFEFQADVSGLILDAGGLIRGVKVSGREIRAGQTIIAAGPWLGQVVARAGLSVPLEAVKRQVFVIAAETGPLRSLLFTPGFNVQGLLPFTIMPGGAYIRPAPAARSFIVGFANQDQPPGLEDRPTADRQFYETRIRPQLESYFPPLRGAAPSHAWAGNYANHPADLIPFVDRLAGSLVVGGCSGSGIMKADALGRATAGLFFGQSEVELADGWPLTVADLALQGRTLVPEAFII